MRGFNGVEVALDESMRHPEQLETVLGILSCSACSSTPWSTTPSISRCQAARSRSRPGRSRQLSRCACATQGRVSRPATSSAPSRPSPSRTSPTLGPPKASASACSPRENLRPPRRRYHAPLGGRGRHRGDHHDPTAARGRPHPYHPARTPAGLNPTRSRIPPFAAGQRLSLVAEPDNPHDRSAVGVWDANRARQVGFLPREFAPTISKALSRGQRLDALSVWEWRGRMTVGTPGRGLTVRIAAVENPDYGRDGAEVPTSRAGALDRPAKL